MRSIGRASRRKLAAALDLEATKVEEALEKVAGDGGPPGPGGPGHHEGFVDDLATELGVEADRVYDALRQIRPDRGDARPGPPLRDLADSLGVSPSELRKALREVWRAERSGFEEKHDELVKFLADRLDVPAKDVEDALGADPFGDRHGGNGGGPPFGPGDGGPPGGRFGGGPPGAGFGGGPPGGGLGGGPAGVPM